MNAALRLILQESAVFAVFLSAASRRECAAGSQYTTDRATATARSPARRGGGGWGADNDTFAFGQPDVVAGFLLHGREEFVFGFGKVKMHGVAELDLGGGAKPVVWEYGSVGVAEHDFGINFDKDGAFAAGERF